MVDSREQEAMETLRKPLVPVSSFSDLQSSMVETLYFFLIFTAIKYVLFKTVRVSGLCVSFKVSK